MKCCFGFKMYLEQDGFVIIKPHEKGIYHQGHKKRSENEMTLRKGEITKEYESRMIEDAGIALPISATQRILNMRSLSHGPYINKSLVREFRASNILKSMVDGSIVKVGDKKGEMDLVLELLKKNNARVAYLAVQPRFGTTKRSSQKEEVTTIVSSTPHYSEEMKYHDKGTFVAQSSSKNLGLVIVKGKGVLLEIKEIYQSSPLHGLVRIGDEIVSVNGKSMSDISISDFKTFMSSIQNMKKSITLWRCPLEKPTRPQFEKDTNSRQESAKPQIETESGLIEEKALCQDLESITGKDKIFTDGMYKELQKIAYKYRNEALDPNEDYELVLSLAWLLPSNYYASLMWASVIYIDSTFNVCTFSNYRQLSIVAKNTNGQAFVICRIGLPHERSYLYDYCLKCVVPKLLSYLFVKRVKVIITDGCPYLIESIERARKDTYVNAIRLRCGWHITYKGFENNVERYLVFHEHCSPDNRRNFKKLLQRWVYSFMKQGVDSLEEYELSKNLLLSWLQSEDVTKNICSKANSTIIVKWLQTSVFPFYQNFAFFCRRDVENGENYTCCIIEGTHNALKKNALAVEKTDTLPIYTKKCNDYDIMKLKEQQAKAATDSEKQYLFGQSFLNRLVEKGALLSYNLIQWSENYVSQFWKCENGLPVFICMCATDDDDEESQVINDEPIHFKSNSKPIQTKDDEVKGEYDDTYKLPRSHPRFHHPWVIKIVKDSNGKFFLICGCLFYKRTGCLCPHTYNCYEKHLKHLGFFHGFCWQDFKITWWKISHTLCYKAYGTHTPEELKLLHELLDQAYEDKRYGPELRLKDDSVSMKLLKHKWDSEKKMGEKVPQDSSCDPLGMINKSAVERLRCWNVSSAQALNESNMVPSSHEMNFGNMTFTYDDFHEESKAKVNSALYQQSCKKKVLDMVYDIVDKVEFEKNQEYFERLTTAIDSFHSQAVQISMNRNINSNSSPIRSFAGTVRHEVNGTPKRRFHAYTERSNSTGTKTPKRRGKKDYNLTSP